MGNSKAISFGSLRCQVRVRSGARGSPAVYLKKGRWVRLGGWRPRLRGPADVWRCFPASRTQGGAGGPRPTPCTVPGFSPLGLNHHG